MSIVANGAILSLVIILVFVFCLHKYCHTFIQQDDILDHYGEDQETFELHLMYARTVAFISLVFSENVRAYTSRSFDRPIWNNFLGNCEMQKAIILAQVCLYVAVLTPGFSTQVLQLDGIGIGLDGWLISLVGPVATLILCESFKLVTAHQSHAYQDQLAKEHAEADRQLALLEGNNPPISAGQIEVRIDDKAPLKPSPMLSLVKQMSTGQPTNEISKPSNGLEAMVVGKPVNGRAPGKCMPSCHGMGCFQGM